MCRSRLKTWGLDGAEIDKASTAPTSPRCISSSHRPMPLPRQWRRGHGDVLADIANYTTIAPVLQTSEIID